MFCRNGTGLDIGPPEKGRRDARQRRRQWWSGGGTEHRLSPVASSDNGREPGDFGGENLGGVYTTLAAVEVIIGCFCCEWNDLDSGLFWNSITRKLMEVPISAIWLIKRDSSLSVGVLAMIMDCRRI